ncbi:MAG: hypothetical protein ACLUSV_00605 [Streptococcus sp.]
MDFKVYLDVEYKPLQITSLTDVILNGTVNILLPNDLKDNVVTFLKYQKFGKFDKEVEQSLLDKVNDILKEQ